ncbi:MAG: dienelactone hydrolase family protein [Tardiphaga sp.]
MARVSASSAPNGSSSNRICGRLTPFAAKPGVEIHIHPDTGHGFARTGYPPYHADATALPRQRTNALLAKLI